MPFQLFEHDVALLREGDQLLYGNRPDNLVPVVVVLGPGRRLNSVCIRFLADYDTNRPLGGNSFYKAGAENDAHVGDLWVAASPPSCSLAARA
jgi:hypothetical protein